MHIALGFCAELETQLVITNELGYMSNGMEDEALEKLDHICRMTRNLIKSLR